MILRRIIAHFRKQEWMAIAIDFLIVVVGVFIGIQVSNWNAAQGDRVREGAYLRELVDDLAADLGQILTVSPMSPAREWRELHWCLTAPV